MDLLKKDNWKIINSYFRDNEDYLVKHHLDSYNDFIINKIMFYLDELSRLEHLVYGHDFILKQTVAADVYEMMHSVDEMIKSSDPKRVFEKYKPLYTKVSNRIKPMNITHTFF